MKKILIRYGELTLKGKNRMFFAKTLFRNIRAALKEFEPEIDNQFDRTYVSIPESELGAASKILSRVPGISSVSICHVVESDIEAIKSEVLTIAQENLGAKTFKLESRRSFKQFPLNSTEIKQIAAPGVLKNTNLTVDVHNPDLRISIEVHMKETFIFTNKIKGLGGLPNGTGGKVLMLLSGGIDSPVASFLLSKRGIHVDYLTFITPPHTDELALQKTRDLVEVLNKYNGGRSFLNICNYTRVQDEISHTRQESYNITLMRRSFLRIATEYAKKHNYLAIATGEAIGQVASQTLESMHTIEEVTLLPVFRPVLTHDKSDIIDIAKDIGTYEISIKPHDDSCSLFAPSSPTTRPTVKKAKELEERIFLLKDIENVVLEEMETEVIK